MLVFTHQLFPVYHRTFLQELTWFCFGVVVLSYFGVFEHTVQRPEVMVIFGRAECLRFPGLPPLIVQQNGRKQLQRQHSAVFLGPGGAWGLGIYPGGPHAEQGALSPLLFLLPEFTYFNCHVVKLLCLAQSILPSDVKRGIKEIINEFDRLFWKGILSLASNQSESR